MRRRHPTRAGRVFSLPLQISLTLALCASGVRADLPDGPGKAATMRVCGRCHSPERAASLHQGRRDWEDTIIKMVKLGAQGSDEELEAVLGYLATHYGRESPKPLEINKARAIDLEAALLLRRSQAEAVIAYRNEHGAFRSIDDLRSIPGLDFQRLAANKSRLIF